MRISGIRLRNFRQFEDFSLSCRETNVLVGPNNAGKSSVLDALRICNDVLGFVARRKPQMMTQEGCGVCPSYILPDANLSVEIANIVRDYGDHDAEIEVRIQNGNKLRVRLHPSKATIAFLETGGRQPTSVAHFRAAVPLHIVVVPTLGPFEADERYVTDETVTKNRFSRLASRNFRNIWLRKSTEDLAELNQLVQIGWPEVVVESPSLDSLVGTVTMYYRESRKSREVLWAGFGFQVWLQMMTHILRGENGTILVLDEPDIYLHPDLQRKLVHIAQSRFDQVFLATHSTEIINEVNAGDILLVQSRTRNARRVASDDGYRQVFAYLGSSENAEFARLARAKRVVFFEGDDRKLFRRFANKVGATLLSDPDTAYQKTGGFGRWQRVLEVGWAGENIFGLNLKIVAIFDRDYRCDEEVEEFKRRASASNIYFHVLGRKEIENYALVEPAIIRTMKHRAKERDVCLSDPECRAVIDQILDQMHSEARANRSGEYVRYHKSVHKHLHDVTLVGQAIASFESQWLDRDARLRVVGGKDFLKMLSDQLQKIARSSITIPQIIGEMTRSEVPLELVEVMKAAEIFLSE